MILIVGVLASAYFMFTLAQNTVYNDTVRQNNLLELNRMSESINVTAQPSYTSSAGSVRAVVNVQNDGPINVEIKTLWVRGTNNDHYGFDNLNLNLSPGNSSTLDRAVNVTGAVQGNEFYGWIITARGRTIELYPAHQTGPAGTDGSTWYIGAGVPANSLGANGDFYFRNDTNWVYNRNQTAWIYIANLTGIQGQSGTNGVSGSTWYYGTSAPSTNIGANGDFYLNTATGDVYNKSNNNWNFIGNIKGAIGNTGPPGPEGPPSVTALVSQGIGSISMDFKSYNSYPVNGSGSSGHLGTPNPAFTFSLSDRIAFSINITNLDPSHMELNLTNNGQMWLFSPANGAIKGEVWPLATVTDNVITTLNSNQFIILPYNHTTTLYFGPYKPGGSNLGTGITAVNLVLTGKIGNMDYGQNLPFISLIATS